MSVDLSIIIVSYNTRDLLRNCLQSVFASQTKYSYEVIVHDNGSPDNSADMVTAEFPQVKLLRGENIGFSAGNNAGIQQASGRNILLLNPDTEIEKDTIEVAMKFFEEHSEIGVLTCKVVLGNGEIDPACRRSFPTPWIAIARFSGLSKFFPQSKFFNAYNLGYLPEDESYEIDTCSGAFFLTRKEVVDRVGLLDEDFFMYNEDVDWCYRIKSAGWKIYYHPETQITHFKRQSSRFSKKAQWEFHRSMIVFHRKHYAHKYPWVINQIAYQGPKIRYGLKLAASKIATTLSNKKTSASGEVQTKNYF
jgi:GT2 family glycosyltransferase